MTGVLSEQRQFPGEIEQAALVLHGERVELDPLGAAFLPDYDVLLVADLHFEKGACLTASGAGWLPPYDTEATMRRLDGLIERHRPKLVVALGDSFHTPWAAAMLGDAHVERLAALVRSVSNWVWIAGNHDPLPPKAVGGDAAEQWALGALTLRHEPKCGPGPGEIAGHLHPCARIAGAGRAVRRKCFAVGDDRMILPALGAFTGGLNVRDPAFRAHFSDIPTAYMLGEARIWKVRAARLALD